MDENSVHLEIALSQILHTVRLMSIYEQKVHQDLSTKKLIDLIQKVLNWVAYPKIQISPSQAKILMELSLSIIAERRS